MSTLFWKKQTILIKFLELHLVWQKNAQPLALKQILSFIQYISGFFMIKAQRFSLKNGKLQLF
jgi:hypothetical protein